MTALQNFIDNAANAIEKKIEPCSVYRLQKYGVF